MRRSPAPWIGLALATLAALPAASAAGEAPAYEALGTLPVMRDGRVKPLDTLARLEVRQIYGRNRIKLPREGGQVEAWGPVAAFFDWSARPEFWDDQDFILVEYLPLKQALLSGAVRARLTALAEKAGTSPEIRSSCKALAASPAVAARELAELARRPGLPDVDRKGLEGLAAKLSEDHKHLSPREIQEARVEVDGRSLPFDDWFADLASRHEAASAPMGRAPKLSTLEERAYEAGVRLLHYRAIRGDADVRVDPFDMIVPRPSNAASLKFIASATTKAAEEAGALRKGHGGSEPAEAPTDLERDAARMLMKYFRELQGDDKAALFRFMDKLKPGDRLDAAGVPGVVGNFRAWLQRSADWVPLRLVLAASPAELDRAGYPEGDIQALRASWKALADAESAAPGKVPEAGARALVGSARSLAEAVGSAYPSPEKVAAETRFNRVAPFYWAPWGYAAASLLLLICLGMSSDPGSSVGSLRRLLYATGMVGLVVGIAWEVYGFGHRVYISGWAPVTNMYETVIWVALVTSVLGLVLELIYRRTYAALAASGVALLATVLAYNVPLLDPSIKNLTPVLRSNYWLTIHVLTIVSSYAAFALAMGLGLIAVCYYLTATYRRGVGLGELAAPLAAVPLVVGLGVLGLVASSRGWWPTIVGNEWGHTLGVVLTGIGPCLAIMALTAMIGELISRASFREEATSVAPVPVAASDPYFAEAAGPGGGVATLARPTVAEIRARTEAKPVRLDARGRAMQATAAKIKPLSNFIYRAMQVGVLLVAAGTILGGVWADYSWGRFWGWDPKEVWALITLLVYLVPLHGRFAGWVNTFGLTVASVACFLSVLMAWYGVNFVLGVGLHSYGFTEGGGQGIVMACTAAVLAFVAGAWWRRHLAYRPASS